MRGWFCLFVLAACTGEPGGSRPTIDVPPLEIGGDTEVTHEPGECTYNVALYGMTGNANATPVGPITVDTSGIDICLSLDARDNLVVAHFAAGTQYETAASSSFELALYDGDGTLLRDGWDVAFGSTPTTAFANLEYGVTKGQVMDAVLWVRAKAGTATSTVNVTLFEPYE
ncbi:MAG TPA: hypothetical protein VFV99_33480 [Kofleriaceae bacterium]|nr:hypothetical protein [Kofleriaceae bacterium]